MERVHCLLLLVVMIASDVSLPVMAQESFCRADIVLVVDHSGSIRDDDVTGEKPNWQTILDFLVSVVNLLDISPDETRMGMVTFGSYATLEFDLDDHKTKSDVEDAIENVPYTGGSTNTTGALRMARTQVLSPAGGDRPDVRDLIVLLTDGRPTIEEDGIGAEVREIKSSGTRIIAIGVTEGVDEDLMKQIASDPVEDHYFHVESFSGLDQLAGLLAEEACDAPSTTSGPVVTQSPDACTSQGDVIFVMDSSGSVGKENFETMKEFVVEIANGLDINSGNVQVGVATFSSDVNLQFHLNEKKSLTDVTSAVRAINFTRGTTNTGAALRLLYSSMFTAANGDRPNINNIGLVLTDGGSNDKEDTQIHALATKVAGHTMLSLGIGSWVDQTELNAIASHPPTDNTFNVKSFADLASVVQTVTALICDSVNECSSDPCQNDGTCINAINAYYCHCAVGYGGTNCEKLCPLRADVAFALDSSGSVGPQNFIKEVNFVKQVVQHLNLNGQSRIAVENFADSAVIRFQLNAYDNVQKVLNGLSIYYKGGSTNTADAINKMRTEMFTSSNGDRANVLNVGVVITDGKSNDRSATLREASMAQDAGILMMAVGVGDGVNTLELEGIASYPSSANVFYADSFDSFDQTLDSLVGSICNDVNECDSNPCQNGADCTDLINGYLCQSCPEGFSGINCERGCSGEIDLGFIVDSSGSIGSRRFPKVLNFIASVAQNLTFGPGGAQVGVVTYSDQAAVRIGLNAYSSVSTLTSAIKNIPYDGKRTNTSGGIWMMSSSLMTSSGGDRPSIPNVAIIITDGCTNIDMDRTIPSALEAKTKGNHMISIGIGGDVNELELRAIASDPQSENLLYADSWKDLPGIVTSLLTSMCNDVNECSAGPCQNGGSCIDMLKKFYCNCATGFSGVNCERSCSRQMDIGFVLDISGSVQVVLDYTVAITKAIVYGLPIGSNMARVGLVSFSEDAAVNFNLNSYRSTLDVLNAIGFAKAGGTTNTQEALDLMRTQLFRSSAGDRNGVPNKAIVITDGRSNVRQRNTIPAAQAAQNDGIEIFVVAVSKDQPGGPDMAEVNGIASDPDSTHVFQVSSTAEIDTAVGQLLDALCQLN